MDRSWVSSLLLLLLLILFFSNASSRGLADEQPPKDTSNKTTTQSPPLPPNVGDGKSNATSSLPASNSTSPDPKEPDSASPPPPPPPPPPQQLQAEGEKNVTVVSNTTEVVSPPPANQTESVDKGKLPEKMAPPPKSQESGEKGNPPPGKDPEKVDDAKGSSESVVVETCAGKSKICRTENSLVACTLSIEKDSSKWSILVQNEGEESLKAKIVLPVSSSPDLTLPKHQSQRVNISISGDTNKIILDAGKGECVLHMYPPQENTLSIHLPSYEKLVTPINGAYFLIVSVVIFGGAWGFCLCRKNRRADDNGVPYRELELSGGPGVDSVHDVETADWDEGWDDDWDENNAVKSPGGAANSARISANGLTARASNRDGWDNDWDD
ncbi:proline-rich receptor-like protein kinase PERK10 [Brassica napus]|uniref:(rape) hypothetical protein n=2 Tax=Brassica napus TaxID=3708 RepID=A0A816VW89_BRANA|nr:proline-rich receptor-like protein kinase PERK10 [Brassica napus]XP_048632709.1 proline-rich receptor-like protein kinase PERK10 [Brassica napus]CAF2129750.1 unnamed protein product [Brassica napus]